MSNTEKIRNGLEEISLKMDNLISVAKVSRTAFEHKEAFSQTAPEDIAGTFNLLAESMEQLRRNIDSLIISGE